MSEDSVGVVRHAYETWNEHGPAAIGPVLADGVELHDAPELPDAQVWRGREAVIARLQAVRSAVGGGSVELRDFSRTDDAILVTMLWRLEGEAGDAELGEVFHLVDVAAGRITRIRVFLTRAEAFRA